MNRVPAGSTTTPAVPSSGVESRARSGIRADTERHAHRAKSERTVFSFLRTSFPLFPTTTVIGKLRTREATKASAGPRPAMGTVQSMKSRSHREFGEARPLGTPVRSLSDRQRPVTAPDGDFEKHGANNHIRASLLVDTSLSPGHRTAAGHHVTRSSADFVVIFKVVVEVPPSLLRFVPAD